MQTKEDLEKWYAHVDPWGYEANPDDARRKEIILYELNGRRFKRALDIGCGEGYITKDLPADEIYGLELSETARTRLPKNVTAIDTPEGKYDLIVATGVFYDQYDWQGMQRLIEKHASKIVLTCNIVSWERNKLDKLLQFRAYTFPYREYTQQIRLYDFSNKSRLSATQHRKSAPSQLQLTKPDTELQRSIDV